MKILAPNTLLQNRYLIVHLIGKGGMGEVYLAVDQRLGNAVALKRTFFTGDETLGNAFEREARILGRLRHPVLPKVSDHFVENDHQYLVMDHITGDDLSKRLELTGKPFPLSWVLFWSDQLLDALTYLHSHEPPIIHRDIKPQNLKLTDENNIILLDFGLSKSSIGDSLFSNSVSSDASGSVVGYTPHYAPMEQIRGTGTSPRSDIYSLSATIYQLLTNSVPPDALTRADALLNGFQDPLKPINEINSEVSNAISDVLIKGMSVSQDLRFASAREMQKELRSAYSQLQTAMSANTVVLPSQDEKNEFVSGQTEPLIVGQSEKQVSPSGIANVETGSIPTKTPKKGENVEETLFYDNEPQQFQHKQSDIKTEVFSGGMMLPESEMPPQVESYSAEETTPLITLGDIDQQKTPSEVDFESAEPKVEDATPETALYVPNQQIDTTEFSVTENPSNTESTGFTENFSFTQDFSKAENLSVETEENVENHTYQPAAAAATAGAANYAPKAQQKSGGGKIFAILTAIGLLMFLGIGGAALGWWYLSGSSNTTETEITPTPAISVTPTPEETLVETNSDANQNSDIGSAGLTDSNISNENSNVSNDLSETNSNTNTQGQTSVIATPIPATPIKTPVQQPTQTTRVTPTPKQTPVTIVTPKPNPTITKQPTPRRNNDSTIILQ